MTEKRNHDSVLRDIKEHPENHVHDYESLIACAIIGGSIDLMIVEAHSQMKPALGLNGGVQCDVIEGPCACGAWH